MHPVIPRIRVGDVLLGTRNLRNWLQTASLMRYVQLLSYEGYSKKSELYLPAKTDRFVVAVNAWETFAVWGLDQGMSLIFCNPSPQRAEETRPIAMGPDVFARWFVRTRGRQVDLSCWPHYAYYLWASLQMNGISGARDDYRLPFSLGGPSYEGGYLTTIKKKYGPRDHVKKSLEANVCLGMTRPNARRRHPASSRFYGPHPQDISQMQKEIRRVTANPRMVPRIVNALSGKLKGDSISERVRDIVCKAESDN